MNCSGVGEDDPRFPPKPALSLPSRFNLVGLLLLLLLLRPAENVLPRGRVGEPGDLLYTLRVRAGDDTRRGVVVPRLLL